MSSLDGSHKASRGGPFILVTDTCLQNHGPAVTPLQGTQSVQAATSPRHPAVSAEARQQPDLYAAAFVRELLTQNYRTSRDQLLAWVQSESAQSTEPLVVGLSPPQLGRWLSTPDRQPPLHPDCRNQATRVAVGGSFSGVTRFRLVSVAVSRAG